MNAISEEIERLDLGSTPGPSLARLKRDEIVALNSTLLHELYSASLGGDGRILPEGLASAIAKDFGSVVRWRQEFVGIASALAGGSGWVLLTYVPRDGGLINQTASEHSQSIAAGCRSSPSICMSTLSTWNSAPTPAPTSPPSCATSINPP
nr:Fe-Mn family superoxide dismutase [Bradyrhizobium betae]